MDQFHEVGVFLLSSVNTIAVFKQGVVVLALKSASGTPMLSITPTSSMAISLW